METSQLKRKVGLSTPLTALLLNSDMDHKARQQRLQKSLSPHRLDALLVTHLPNVRYLCGFTGSAGALLVSGTQSVFFTDGRYTDQARAEVQAARIVITRKGPMAGAADWLSVQQKAGRRASSARARVGIEGEHLTVAARSRLAKLLPSERPFARSSAAGRRSPPDKR